MKHYCKIAAVALMALAMSCLFFLSSNGIETAHAQAGEPIPYGAVGSYSARSDGNHIYVTANVSSSNELKVQFSANGQVQNYSIKSGAGEQKLLPSLGSGSYTVQIVERIDPSANKYRSLYKTQVNVKINDAPTSSSASVPSGSISSSSSSSPYLGSSVEVNWSNDMAAVKKAKELVKAAKAETNAAKATAIYNYLSKRLVYDYSLLGKLPGTYKPTIDNTYRTDKGICYDFAALYAGMLRSVGVPAKLVKGTSDKVHGYHAWNQIDMDGTWVTVDLSVDAQLREFGKSYQLKKPNNQYHGTSYH